MRVVPNNQGQHYRTLPQRMMEIASALGWNATVAANGLNTVNATVHKTGQASTYKWAARVEGRSDDDVVAQFSQWLASVR